MELLDVRPAVRSLRRRKGLALAAVAVLGAALGFNTAVFSIVNTLLLRPYPFRDLSQLMLLRDHRPGEGAHQGSPIASGDFLDLRRDTRSFTGVAALRPFALVLRGNGDPERVEGTAVSANFFDVLGARTLLGRTFATDEDEAGRDDRVVLSARYWKARFAEDATLVGRAITLNGRSTTVIGIIPNDACYPPGVDAWVPLVLTPVEQEERAAQHLRAVARLRPSISPAAARADVDAVAARLARAYPATNRDRGFGLQALQKEQYEFTGPLFLMVQVAALLVLMLGGANVSNLLLAQAVDRQREFGIRFALGASRRRLFGQLLLEAIAVTAAAGLAGLLLATWSIPLIRAALPEGIARWVAGWESIQLDATVVGATAALTLATGTVLGSVSGWHAIRAGALHALRDTGRSGGARLTWMRRALIVGEVAFAMVLLLGAGVTRRGFARMSEAFASLVPRQALVFGLSLPRERYPDDRRIVAFQDRLVEAIAGLPGVESAGLVRNEPASNVPSPVAPLAVNGRAPLTPGEVPRVDVQSISPGAFPALRLRTLSGRLLGPSDVAAAPRVAVLSGSMARSFWPNTDPVGAQIRLGTDAAWITIVGVASDLKLNWYDSAPRPTVYLPHAQAASREMRVIVRAAGDPRLLAAPIRALAKELDSAQPLDEMQGMDTTVAESLSPIRVLGFLLLIGGGLAVLFAGTGIYGVLAHWVASRSREFGVRLALGASPDAISRLVLRQMAVLTLAGMLVALPAGLSALFLMRTSLFGLGTADLPTVAGLAAFVCAVAALAALRPAGRARQVDPRLLLQSE